MCVVVVVVVWGLGGGCRGGGGTKRNSRGGKMSDKVLHVLILFQISLNRKRKDRNKSIIARVRFKSLLACISLLVSNLITSCQPRKVVS